MEDLVLGRPALADLNFAGNEHGWTNELRELISMRMFQCVRLAKETIGETITGLAWPGPAPATHGQDHWLGRGL